MPKLLLAIIAAPGMFLAFAAEAAAQANPPNLPMAIDPLRSAGSELARWLSL